MNIYKFELKMLRGSVLVWTSAIVSGLIFYMVFFPLMMVDNDSWTNVMQNFPDEFLAFFGMNADLSFTTILGYFGLTISFIYVPVSIQAAVYGISTLSVEEREYTADFLMTKPVSRSQIFFNKLLAAFTALTITNIGIWIGSYISLVSFNGGMEVDYGKATILLSTIIFFQLFFLGTGMLISMLVKKVTSVIGYSMALGFGLFIISSFGEMLSLNIFKIVTPYSHFNPIDILVAGNYYWPFAIITIIAIPITFTLGYFLYQRRNIAAL